MVTDRREVKGGSFSDWSDEYLYIDFIDYGWYWTKDAKDNDFAWVHT
ncbi:hypothetical protein [Segatella salivae]|nr:hypothetical protein [Segatella salivae]